MEVIKINTSKTSYQNFYKKVGKTFLYLLSTITHFWIFGVLGFWGNVKSPRVSPRPRASSTFGLVGSVSTTQRPALERPTGVRSPCKVSQRYLPCHPVKSSENVGPPLVLAVHFNHRTTPPRSDEDFRSANERLMQKFKCETQLHERLSLHLRQRHFDDQHERVWFGQ